jgi:hypothetical protein
MRNGSHQSVPVVHEELPASDWKVINEEAEGVGVKDKN